MDTGVGLSSLSGQRARQSKTRMCSKTPDEMSRLPADDPLHTPAALAAISAEIAQIHARGHGRTADTTETVWHDDVIVCVLEGVLTESEHELVEQGRFEGMRAERLGRHEPLAPRFRALIEAVSGRPVRAYMTEVGPEDVAFEVFVLG
jgi:uncharacterized protein YbcI